MVTIKEFKDARIYEINKAYELVSSDDFGRKKKKSDLISDFRRIIYKIKFPVRDPDHPFN